jgi:flagellar protein FlaF
MNREKPIMWANQLHAYNTIDKATMSGREIEAAVLTKAALKLRNCQKYWDAEDREERLNEALQFNQRVWSIFQGELAREDHPLPKKLRFDVLRLSAFIDKRILETMASPAPEKLGVVIDINNNIAAGLRGSPQ